MKKMLLTCSAFLMVLNAWSQVPKADLLDVVFNDDGTAVDVSPLANEVHAVGTPKVLKSDRWGMNVLCTASSVLGSTQDNCFTVDLNDEIWNAVKDGHSIECFVRPFWDGALNKKGWGTILGFQQNGGCGMLVYKGEWCFEPHVGGSYVDAWGGTPIAQRWTHLVGVVDSENGLTNIYVNGKLINSVECEGELGYPTATPAFIGIGGDLSSTPGVLEAAFPGDIAIARVYDKPLNAEEVDLLYKEIQSKDTGAEEHKEESKFPDIRYDENGVVRIATAKELNDYALLTKIAPYTSAILEADIDYTEYNDNISYYGSNAFAAIFDGNGHTVTVNFDFSGVETTGFVADAINGAVIKDLTIEGNVRSDQKWCGILFGENYGARAENITIRANLECNYAGACYNGVLSGWDEKTCSYENIVIESTLSGSGTYMGGLIGDVAGTTYLKNVLVVTNSAVDDPTQNSPLVASPRSGTHFENVYYVNQGELTLSDHGATELTIDDVANGTACYLLNQGNISSPIFYQNLDEDNMPSLDPERGIVVKAGNSYTYFTGTPESMIAVRDLVAQNEAEIASEAEVYAPLKEALLAETEAVMAASSIEEFVVIYNKIQEIRKAISENAAAYEQLRLKAEEILPTLDNMTSQFALELIQYLTEEIEPNDTYINGSYVYIYDNKTLDTESIYAEIANMEALQKRITAADAPAGTDVTVLLNNPDFSNGFAGWSGDDLTGYGTNGKMWAAENWGKNSFNIYQELSGLKNGVYAVRIRGGYRPFNDQMANQYWPFIYANENANYLQTVKEGMISVEEAVDKENCYIVPDVDNIGDREIYDMDGNVIGYALHGVQSSCYAFQAGRYPNYILTNVTDGKLKIGVQYDYSQFGDNEWLGIGDVNLTYCGTIEEAAASIDENLQAMLQRAATIQEYQWSDADDYAYYPNFAQNLKDRITAVSEAYANQPEATAAQKYAWIEELSDVYRTMISSKMEYRELAGVINRFYDRIGDYPAHQEEIQRMHDEAWDAWRAGTYATSEDIQAKIEELTSTMDAYEVDVPAADLLDIVFNLDGTATDKSPMQNPVEIYGDVRVVESPLFGHNVLCIAHNEWSKNGNIAHYRVPSNETIETAMSDGVTMECYVRPTWDGEEMPWDWTSAFGFTEVGGMGLMVYNGMWTYEIRVGGSYCDAAARNIPVVKDEWIHLVGVWNKEEGTAYIYINGEYAGSVAADGDFNLPTPSTRFLAIGADLCPDAGQPQAGFEGDIAIARLYDSPLNASQVNKIYKNIQATLTGQSEHDCSQNADGISGVEETVKPATGIFNIMGQKVSRPTKGLYIINGKKVLVK